MGILDGDSGLVKSLEGKMRFLAAISVKSEIVPKPAGGMHSFRRGIDRLISICARASRSQYRKALSVATRIL